ncbi:MAG: beta-propeller fold lactonase family protein [Thermoplasmata archaeon]|nr:beta-propeller fold lactonase family protein [Thermoplasmata archaeon]
MIGRLRWAVTVGLVVLLLVVPALLPLSPGSPTAALSRPDQFSAISDSGSGTGLRVGFVGAPSVETGRPNSDRNGAFVHPAGTSLTLSEKTLDLTNGTLLPGNVSLFGAHGPSDPTVYDPISGRFYLSTIYSQTVAVVNASRDVDLVNVPLDFYAGGLAVDPVDDSLFVTNDSGNSVAIVNATTLSVMTTVAVGPDPQGIAWDPAAGAMVVANAGSNNTSWIDGRTHQVVANVATGTYPMTVLYDSLTGDVLIGNWKSANVSVLNATSVVATLPAGSFPSVVYQDPVDGTLFVSNAASGNTTILNGTSYRAVANLSVSTATSGIGYDPGTNRVDVLAGSTVLELNASNNSVVGSTPVTFWSRDLGVDPTTNEVYVSGGVNNSVTILNDSTGAVVASVPSAYTPTVAQFDPLNGEMYISEEGGANVSALNGTTHAVASDILLGTQSNWDGASPTDATVYLGGGCPGSNVEQFDTSNGTSTGCLVAPVNSYAGAFDPVDHRLFLTDGYSEVYATNLTTGVTVRFVSLGTSPYATWPMGLAWSPVNDSLFVVNELTSNVTVVDASNGHLRASVNVGSYPEGAAYDPTDGAVWVANTGGSSISEINVTNDSLAGTVSVGSSPAALVFDATTQQMFVTLSGSDTVAVVSAANGTVVKRLPVGTYPEALTLDPSAQLVFVANEASSNLTVVDALGLVDLANEGTVNDPIGVAYDATSGVLVASSATDPSVSVIRPTLVADPDVTVFRATPATISLGNSTQFTATVARGNGTLTYRYSGLPNGCSSANSSVVVCTPTIPGNFSVTVNVTDQTGASANATTPLSVLDHLAVTSLVASPSVVDVGVPTNLTVTVTGTSPPFAFLWTGLPAGCASVNASSWSCTPTVAGNFTVGVNVTDSFGHEVRATTALTVVDRLSINSLTASPSVVDVGMAVNLTAGVTGDAPPFSFDWTGLPRGCVSQNASAIPCRPTQSGAYTTTLRVEDALGLVRSSNVGVTVQPTLTLDSLVSDYGAIDLGQSVQITASASGGSAPLSVRFSGLPSGCVGPVPTVFSFACRPNETGTFLVGATVTDALGATTNGTLALVVNSDPSFVSLVATPSPANEGTTLHFAAQVSGGTLPLVFAYAGLPAGCRSANLATLACAPTVTGTFEVTANVTDARGLQASQGIVEVITAAPPPPDVTSFLANPNPVTLGNASTLTAIVSGGTSPLSYAFTGLPAGCASTDSLTLQCLSSSIGSFPIEFHATDAANRTATGATFLNVTATPSLRSPGTTSTNVAGLPPLSWLAIVAAVAVAAVLGALWFRRARGPRSAPPPSEDGEGVAPAVSTDSGDLPDDPPG